MKHAIIILAHKESENLFSLVQYFNRECDVFIHFDKKAKISPLFISKIEDLPQVKKVYRKYTVNWGGFSMLRCEMFMLKQTLEKSDASYFHLISGQDYPIKPLDCFLQFFDNHYGLNFISFTHLPNLKWQGNTFDRITYFYPTDIFSDRITLKKKILKYVGFQKRMRLKRNIPLQFDHIYGGSQWFSLSRIGVDSLVRYTYSHRLFYWRFLFTFAPEEAYPQTVLVNILPRTLIISHNYRFIRWNNENGNNPSNLGKEHFHLLAKTNDLFARKLISPYANELIPLINQYLLQDNECQVQKDGTWVYNGFQKYHYEERFANAITQYVRWSNAQHVVDVGCGAGFLVAALRRRGVFATGFDANPYTPTLSALLLPPNDSPCYQANLMDGIETDSPFDVAMCFNVLSSIPQEQREKAMHTLASLTSFSLIVSFDTMSPNASQEIIHSLNKDFNFKINVMATSYISIHTHIYKNIVVMEKTSQQALSLWGTETT